jgi:hypothetical protein
MNTYGLRPLWIVSISISAIDSWSQIMIFFCLIYSSAIDPSLFARMAELVDAKDLKSFVPKEHAGSIPAPGTNIIKNLWFWWFWRVALKNVQRILE